MKFKNIDFFKAFKRKTGVTTGKGQYERLDIRYQHHTRRG